MNIKAILHSVQMIISTCKKYSDLCLYHEIYSHQVKNKATVHYKVKIRQATMLLTITIK